MHWFFLLNGRLLHGFQRVAVLEMCSAFVVVSFVLLTIAYTFTLDCFLYSMGSVIDRSVRCTRLKSFRGFLFVFQTYTHIRNAISFGRAHACTLCSTGTNDSWLFVCLFWFRMIVVGDLSFIKSCSRMELFDRARLDFFPFSTWIQANIFRSIVGFWGGWLFFDVGFHDLW